MVPASATDTRSSAARLRLKIANYGQTPARYCECRLIELRTSAGEALTLFNPQTLYWSQQNAQTGFSAVTIQGYGDYHFLDIAESVGDTGHLIFCSVCPVEASPTAQEPEYLPVSCFMRLGIYAEGVRNTPIWLQLTADGQLLPAQPPAKS
jgi:hypothetical protein